MTKRARAFSLPREHGFWTMLAAVQLTTLIRVGPKWETFGAVLGASLLLAVGGGLTHRAIRRRPSLQIASATLLGLSGLPVELGAGRPALDAIATASAWAVLFTGSALVVRGAFARGRRRDGGANRFERVALLLTMACALAAALGGLAHQALALSGAGVCLFLIARTRPTTKDVKRVGLGLAGAALVAAAFLVIPLPL